MAGDATDVRVLGPFELVHEGQVMPVGGPVGQAIVTVLACRPDTKVLPAELITMVWGAPDAASAETLYSHVTRLRRVLTPAGLAIVGHRPGYRLPVAAEQVDLARFDELLRTARALSDTDPDEAGQRLRAAVGLWRGPSALDNVMLPGIRRLAAAWEARRLDAEEELAEIDLRRGRPDHVLDRLHTLAATHSGRPRLAAALARALAATGRTDQAHTVLAQAERTARGAGDPVHTALVQARRALGSRGADAGSGAGASAGWHPSSPSAQPDPTASAVMPFQLPADTVRFTGRADYLTRLLDLRPDPDGSDGSAGSGGPAPDVVIAVEGMAGIGKTALAVHAGHRLADRFCDGVLFTDLRGFTPQVEPTAPEHALDHLLRGLGVPGPQIPPDLDGRVGLYRSVLARRRVLVVLDNAADEAQVGPLLPATPSCRTIVTSRRHLAGLDDATHLTLPVLDPGEAADLFRGLGGDRVTSADQVTVERIVALCGRLPLAVRIAAARLRLAPTGSPATVWAELADALGVGSGLEWLSDGHRAVSTALAVSYRHLTADQQRALSLAGLHPGRSIEPYALAALADATVRDAARLLDQLYAASLLDQPAHRRYTVHDLVAAYAATLAVDLPEPDRQAALDRLYDHYAVTSTQAMNLTYPWEADQQPRPPATHTPVPTLTGEREAQAWLDSETDNLLAAAHHAATGHRADHTLHQSATLRRHLRTRGHYSRAALLHQQALTSARHTANQAAEQDALSGLGYVHRIQGRNGPAAKCFERALAGARRTGNRTAEQDALTGLGYVHYVQGRYGAATESFEQALAGARQTGNHPAEQRALVGLGTVHSVRGRYGPAAECFERALAGARQTGNHPTAQNALRGLGGVHYLQGRYEPAAGCFEQALAGARRTGDHTAEQDALTGLGYVHYLRGRHRPAADCFEHVLAVARQTGDRNWQFEAHQGLGRVHHATGQRHDALHHQHTALQLAVELDQPADQARVHDGLAHTHHALGDPDQARRHWQAALDLLTGIGTDHTEEPGVTTAAIRAHVHDIDSTNRPSGEHG